MGLPTPSNQLTSKDYNAPSDDINSTTNNWFIDWTGYSTGKKSINRPNGQIYDEVNFVELKATPGQYEKSYIQAPSLSYTLAEVNAGVNYKNNSISLSGDQLHSEANGWAGLKVDDD